LICWSAGLQTGGLRFLKLAEREFGAPEGAGLKNFRLRERAFYLL
jgi:hypothetical protein